MTADQLALKNVGKQVDTPWLHGRLGVVQPAHCFIVSPGTTPYPNLISTRFHTLS